MVKFELMLWFVVVASHFVVLYKMRLSLVFLFRFKCSEMQHLFSSL